MSQLTSVRSKQTTSTCDSFEWQWTVKKVYDSERTLWRKLFTSRYLWHDSFDNKIVAEVGSGMGRFIWALAQFTKAQKIISIELSPGSLNKQKSYISDPRVEFIQGDLGAVPFSADIIMANGVIQHVKEPAQAVKHLVDCLNPNGELIISFYRDTIATRILRYPRFILSKLPKKVLWGLTPLLAPIFMVRPEGRESGFKNAMHTAYDFFGSHEYQKYFTLDEVYKTLTDAGIHRDNILQLSKGLFRAKKGEFPFELSSELKPF